MISLAAMALCAALFTTIPTRSVAQVSEAATAAAVAAIGNWTVGNLLDDLERRLLNVSADLRNNMNLALANGHAAATSTLEGMKLALRSERERLVSDLDGERQLLLGGMHALTDSLLKREVPDAQARVVVDVLKILNRVRLLAEQTPFLVTHISPSVLTHKESGDFQISLRGIGFELSESTGRKKPVVTYGEKRQELPSDSVFLDPHGLALTLPGGEIRSLFTERERFVTVPVSLSATAQKRCWLFFSCDEDYTLNFAVILHPRIAGRATLEQIVVDRVTDQKTRQVIRKDVPTCNAHNSSPCAWSTGPVTASSSDYRIVGFRNPAECHQDPKYGNPCAFTKPDGFVANCQIVDFKSASCHGTHQSYPVTLKFEFWEEKEIEKRTVVSGPSPIEFELGKAVPIRFSSRATSVILNVNYADGSSFVASLRPSNLTGTGPLICTAIANIGQSEEQSYCTLRGL
jgi:hypothetical protein